MPVYYHISLFIHIISAMFWMGGMLFFVAIIIPVSRRKVYAGFRGDLVNRIGRRFSRYSWVVFGLLIITGITNLLTKGFSAGDLVSAAFWQSGYGSTLHSKLHFFLLMLVLSAVHDFYLGPKATRLMSEEPEAARTARLRKAAGWIGRINLVLGFLIIYYALSLGRG